MQRFVRVWEHRTDKCKTWQRYLPSDADKLTKALELRGADGVTDANKVEIYVGENIYDVDISNIERINKPVDPDSIPAKAFGRQTLRDAKFLRPKWRHVRTFVVANSADDGTECDNLSSVISAAIKPRTSYEAVAMTGSFLLRTFDLDYTDECDGDVNKLRSAALKGQVVLPDVGGYVQSAPGQYVLVKPTPDSEAEAVSDAGETQPQQVPGPRRVWQHKTLHGHHWERYLQCHADQLNAALEAREEGGRNASGEWVVSTVVVLSKVQTEMGERTYQVDISNVKKIDAPIDPDAIPRSDFGTQTLFGNKKKLLRVVRTFVEVVGASSPASAAISDASSSRHRRRRRVWQHFATKDKRWTDYQPHHTKELTRALDRRNRTGAPATVTLPPVATLKGPRQYTVTLHNIPPIFDQPIGEMPPERHYGRQDEHGTSKRWRLVRSFEVYEDSDDHDRSDSGSLSDSDLHTHRVLQRWLDASVTESRLGTGIDLKIAQSGYFSLSVVKVKKVISKPAVEARFDIRKEELKKEIRQKVPLSERHPIVTVGQHTWVKDCRLQIDRSCNELLLFHGCGAASVMSIVENGFVKTFSKLRGLFGQGIYFTQDPAKADQYCTPLSSEQKDKFGIQSDNEVYAMIVARVCMGAPAGSISSPITSGFIARGLKKFAAPDTLFQTALHVYKELGKPEQQWSKASAEKMRIRDNIVHSIIGRGMLSTHALEFVVYDNGSCIPSHVIFYERRFSREILTHSGRQLIALNHPRMKGDGGGGDGDGDGGGDSDGDGDGWAKVFQEDLLKGGHIEFECGTSDSTCQGHLTWRWRAPKQSALMKLEHDRKTIIIDSHNPRHRVGMQPVWLGPRLILRVCGDDGNSFLMLTELWAGSDGYIKTKGCGVPYLSPPHTPSLALTLSPPNGPIKRTITKPVTKPIVVAKWLHGTWEGRVVGRRVRREAVVSRDAEPASLSGKARGQVMVARRTLELVNNHFHHHTRAPDPRNISITMDGQRLAVTQVLCQSNAFTIRFNRNDTQWVATLNVMAKPLRFHGCFRKLSVDKISSADCGILYSDSPRVGHDSPRGGHGSAWEMTCAPSIPNLGSINLLSPPLPPPPLPPFPFARTPSPSPAERKSPDHTVCDPDALTNNQLSEYLLSLLTVARDRGIITTHTHGMFIADIDKCV